MTHTPPDERLGPERLNWAVKVRRERRDQWRREGERSMAQNLAMIGALGWLIVVPMLAGMFAGRWLDQRLGTGHILTCALLVAGLSLGCVLAWKRATRE